MKNLVTDDRDRSNIVLTINQRTCKLHIVAFMTVMYVDLLTLKYSFKHLFVYFSPMKLENTMHI